MASLAETKGAQELLASAGYIADDELATALFLARELQRPLLFEGEAGVGKTAVAAALATALGARLIRLQCYEGLDAQAALYEWNYQKQLLAIRLGEGGKGKASLKSIFTAEYLLERPLLAAIRQKKEPVLLIDEIDRADEEFEAFLLEVLADYQVTVPEIGTLEASSIPIVILTSNATRVLSDALRRRCLYHYLDYPDAAKEEAIVRSRHPAADEALVAQAVRFVQLLRREDLDKKPGIAETLDWIGALVRLKITRLSTGEVDPKFVATLACLLKTAADRQAVPPERAAMLVQMAA